MPQIFLITCTKTGHPTTMRAGRLAAHLAELELFPAERIQWVRALSGDGMNIPHKDTSLPAGGTGVPTREPRPAGGFGGGFLNIFRRNRN